MSTTPEIFVIAGPNGAGKSTTASVLLPKSLHIDQFVNADLIAKGLSPFAPEKSAIQAGRLMLQRIRELRKKRESFGFETTLASRNQARFLVEAQKSGYLVHVIYLWLSSVELALSRIRLRVSQGGHDVPEEVVQRRFGRGLKNFFEIYKPLADTWTLCDNSGEQIVFVACGQKEKETTVFEKELYESISGRPANEKEKS